MKEFNFYVLIERAQDFILRLFVEKGSNLNKHSNSYYTCAHCGTHARIHH